MDEGGAFPDSTAAAHYTDTVAVSWLTPNEMRAWRAFIQTEAHLRTALEADLTPFGLTSGDYEVLVVLSEAPDRRMRMCDLASRLGLTPSGLTRRLDGLVKAHQVERSPSTCDRRVMLASVTELGMQAMANAAQAHVASVRLHLIDRLSAEQIQALGDIFVAVGNGLGRQLTVV